MVYLTDAEPSWISQIPKNIIENKEFITIMDFFLFRTPVKSLSARSNTLQQHGWNTPWKKPYWLQRHLRRLSSNYCLLFSTQKYDNMEDTLARANLKDGFPSVDTQTERICIFDRERNQFMSVFYHLRDSFAHGRFNIVDDNNDWIFLLEDVVPNQKSNMAKVSARMIIKKSTLLAWIDCISNGQKIYVKEPKENEN